MRATTKPATHRLSACAALVAAMVLGPIVAHGESTASGRTFGCGEVVTQPPQWIREQRVTVLVDSVLLGGMPALRAEMPSWTISQFGRPAIMLRAMEGELRARGRRVAPLVVMGVGYNSLWERGRGRYGYWAARFDREARRLLRTLRRLGARQFVWVKLRQPTSRTVPPSARDELGQYSWYFPYVNERLGRLAGRRDDLVVADWRRAGDRPGLTYDTIHLNPAGARLMSRTIERAICREALRQSRRSASPAPTPTPAATPVASPTPGPGLYRGVSG